MSNSSEAKHEWPLLCCDTCGRIHLDDEASDSESCECGRFKQRMEWAKSSEVMAYINALRSSHAELLAACEAKDAEIVRLREALENVIYSDDEKRPQITVKVPNRGFWSADVCFPESGRDIFIAWNDTRLAALARASELEAKPAAIARATEQE